MQPLNRLQMAWRAAQDIADKSLVNLGLGMPIAVEVFHNVLPASDTHPARRGRLGRQRPGARHPARERVGLRPIDDLL